MAPPLPPGASLVAADSSINEHSDEDNSKIDGHNKNNVSSGDKLAAVGSNPAKHKPKPGCWYHFRRSKVLVVLIVFIAMMLDLMLITSVEPILPPLVYSVMQPNATERFLANAFLFQRPDDDKRIEMVASGRKKRQSTTNGRNHSKYHYGENATALATENCTIFFSELSNSGSAHFILISNTSGYFNNTGEIITCKHNSSTLDHHLKLFQAVADNETVFTDPYLVYALEMSTLFSLKPAAEIFSNILSGLIVNRYGHRNPLVVGCLSTLLATLGFAFSPWYWMLALTRVIQAVGSSLSVVAGLALMTSVFTNEAERNRANSLAYDGLTLGLLLGMPFGSTLYNFSGRQTPFLILAFLVLVDLILRCLYVDDDAPPPPHANRSATECLRETRSIYCSLLSNVDVVVALLCALILNGALGALMASSPAYILDTYGADQWQIGVILVCGAAAQLSSQTFAGFVLANVVRPWVLSMTGFFLYGLALIGYTHAPSLWFVILPECIGRIGFGLFTCVITPLLARIVDVCFQDAANYGAIFGLYVASYNLGLAVGPLITAALVDYWGASVTYWVIGSIVIVSGLLNLRFRKPLVPKKLVIMDDSLIKVQQPVVTDERRRLLSVSCDKPRYESVDGFETRTVRSASARSASITMASNAANRVHPHMVV